MNKNTNQLPRAKAQILADIASLPNSVQGTICSYKNKRKDGSVAIYHNLQWWENGRNKSLHVPEEKVEQMQKAIESGKRLRELVFELSVADANEIISSASPFKKNSQRLQSKVRPKSDR